MQPLNLPSYSFNIQTKEQKKYIFDDFRKKFVRLTPEEWVRQHFVRYLVQAHHYPAALIALEKELDFNRVHLRADVVVYSRKAEPLLIVECKAPDVPIRQEHFDQIVRYNMQLKVSYLMLTNGLQHYCVHLDLERKNYRFLGEIPDYEEL